MDNIYSYIWSFIGKFGLQFVYLFTNIVLARLLTPQDFGIIGVLTLIFSIAQTLSDAGLGGALIMEKELNKKNCGTIFIFNFVISICLYLVVFICAPIIESFYDVESIADVARVLGLVFILHAIGIVPKSILTYQLRFKELSIVIIISVIISAIISIIFAFNKAGVYSLVVFQLSNALLTSFLYMLVAKYRVYICFDVDSFKRMFSFGFFTTIINVVDSFYENLTAAIFGKVYNVSQAGYFSQAKKLEEASIQSLVLTVNTTAFPVLSKFRDQMSSFEKEADSLRKTIPLIIAPLLFFMGAYANEIIIFLFGVEWLESSIYLKFLLIAGFFMINESISRNFIKALGLVKLLFKYTIIKRLLGCFVIILASFVSPKYILHGYVVSAALGYLINAIVYSKIINVIPYIYIYRSIADFIPLLPLFLVIYTVHFLFLDLYINLFLSFSVLVLYYFSVLHYLGLSIRNILSVIIKNK